MRCEFAHPTTFTWSTCGAELTPGAVALTTSVCGPGLNL